MAGDGREGPVAEFCAGLRRLQQECDLGRATLARRLHFSRSQLYEILDGRIRRPPEWDRLVEPLVRVCTGDDERAVAMWRHRHDVLVAVYSELTRQDRQDRPEGPARPVVGAPRVVPAQLPADVDAFTGRAQELAELDHLLPLTTDQDAAAGAGSTAVVISAVSGAPGMGKTALALRCAHRVRGEFPDGQLYVNLRGYDPDQPLSAGDALAGFLRALGVAGAEIPLEVEERAAAYRSLLDGRRMLVVLDNASSVEQVRPLLPGTPSVLVVVTSRDSLAGLVARHGARRLDLDLLPPEDAVALLRTLIGERAETAPDAAAVLAGQCVRLPNDLLRGYATYLAGIEDSEQQRRAALTRLFDHYLATAGAAMDTLHPAEQHRRPRIGPLGASTPPVPDPHAARAWLDAERTTLTAVSAHTASRGWPGHTTGLATTLCRYLEVGGHHPEALTIHTHALHAAYDADDLTAVVHALSNLGTVYWRLDSYQQAADHLQQALTLAREIGDQAGEAYALDQLGTVHCRQGRYPQAVDHHQQALTLAREIGYRPGEALALNGIGQTHHATEHYEQAHAH